MINPNEKGLLYYGTSMEQMLKLDQEGIDKPMVRQEQYISVSVSGYEGILPCEHPELKGMAEVFSNALKVAEFKDGYLKYHEGYVNSMTCFQGFGPCPNEYIHTFYGLSENYHDENRMTVVLSSSASKWLSKPDKDRKFEYLSLALHGFVSRIVPEDIIGWIVEDCKYDEILNKMKDGTLKQRALWKVSDFKPLELDLSKKNEYVVQG